MSRRGRRYNKAFVPSTVQGNRTARPITTAIDERRFGLFDALNVASGNPGFFGMVDLPRDPADQVPFGPLNPLTPAPLDMPRPDSGRPEPRVFEYPVAWNLPGNGSREVPWQVLRMAATNVDIIRRCIETRKRHIRSLEWSWSVSAEAIQDAYRTDPRRGRDDIEFALREKYAPEIARLTDFWRRPWGANGLSFGQWINMVVEEYLVLDAVSIYPRASLSGTVLDLEVIDGATIKPLLDWRGARPMFPHPAFQQLLYGFPRGEFAATVELGPDGTPTIPNGYTSSQLYYYRENARTHSPYGLSPTEQALYAARLYLRRRGWMLAEYDDGSTPVTLIVPPDQQQSSMEKFTPAQRRIWEDALNDEYKGQTAARHRMKVTPPGWTPHQMTSDAERYKPEYDLYLLKFMSSFYGVTIAELGFTEAGGLGSTGYHEGQAEVQDRVGLRPDTMVLKDLINDVSRQFLAAPRELCFGFTDPKQQNETEEDAVADAQYRSARITLNDDRRRRALPLYDFPEADMPMLITPTGPVFLEGSYERSLMPPPAPPSTGQPLAGEQGSTEADLVTKHVGADAMALVRRQLAPDYPPDCMEWISSAKWHGPATVPLSSIDFSGAASWQASGEPDKVDRFADHIANGRMKPIILVRTPGATKMVVVDGHHRALAYRKLGRPALAWVGDVNARTGPWDEMHASQSGDDGRSTGDEPVSAPPVMTKDAAGIRAELAAYRTWSKRNPMPRRPFMFRVAEPDDVMTAGLKPDRDRMAFAKAATDDPKDDAPREPAENTEADRRWPAWEMDMLLADIVAGQLSAALIAAVPVAELIAAFRPWSAHWRVGDPVPDVRGWLRHVQNGAQAIERALEPVVRDAATQGYFVGERSASAVLDIGELVDRSVTVTADWSGWRPGDVTAARRLLAEDGVVDTGLRRVLDDTRTTVPGIADTRLDEIAAVLSDALEQGMSVDETAKALRGVIDDPEWAKTVAWTATNYATSAAAMDDYAAMGILKNGWLTAFDQRVCPICKTNEDEGPVTVGHEFPSGDRHPPGHPRCRCALIPVFAVGE